MKLRKLLSITLALLLVVSLLPTSALAEDISKDQNTVDSGETFENNNATVTTNNGTIETNNGTIVTNNGIIETNNGTVGSYVDPANKEPDTNTGNSNEGGIFGNTGTVIVNDGGIGSTAQQDMMKMTIIHSSMKTQPLYATQALSLRTLGR